MSAAILVADTSGTILHNGRPEQIVKGVTLIREGHPLLRGHESMFRPLRVHYEVEQATETADRSSTARTRKREPVVSSPVVKTETREAAPSGVDF